MKNRPKAAIIYLVGPELQDRIDLKLSLASLDKSFKNQFHYPVILFHENLDEAMVEEIQKSASSKLQFEKIVFQIPDFLQKEEIPEKYNGFTIGYRHMCRFFAGIAVKHPVLKEYDWYWRLDTDSFLLGEISYDVFSFMEQHGKEYGYMIITKENPEVMRGFWELTKTYIAEHNIKSTFLDKFLVNGDWDRTYYNPNFEIIKLDFWRSPAYRDYFNFIDHSGGIYKYRWGDAIIHSLAIAMFLLESKLHLFDDIAYRHQAFINLPNTPKILRFLHRRLIRWSIL